MSNGTEESISKEEWTLREKLVLLEAVKKYGEKNWASISRVLRQHIQSNRNSMLFGSRKCAAVYEAVLNDYPSRCRLFLSTFIIYSLLNITEPDHGMN